MTENEKQELLSLVKDNNKLLKAIWYRMIDPNNDIKDFIMNVIANQIGDKQWTKQ